MANNQINKLLEFANMQMAAEAFLIEGVESSVPENQVSDRLERGNTHASRFTPVQAQQFTEQYEVLAQYRNDSLLAGGTGFSATLFKNRATGELTLSFRSTEFIDDAARDNAATNDLEIKDLGWAFGQIAQMETWYAQLRSDPDLLAGQNFNVTGYSLGGHLATAFNILRREEYAAAPEFSPVLATYTFNGAGTGAILNGRRLTDLIADFDRIRANYAASPEWNALSLGEQNNLLAAAQLRIDAIVAERVRVAGLENLNPSFGVSGPAGGQVLLGYQIAALLVSRDTVGSFASNPFPDQLILAAPSLRFSNMTEIVGMETAGSATSFVSNSGIHYGTRQEVAIEAQPLYRGNFPFSVLSNFLKLIGNNPYENDFADTHSLVLVVDALALMSVLETLAPALTIETAGQIFAAMSSASAGALPLTQGTAEGDTLERMLDALRNLVMGSTEATLNEAQMGQLLDGNTWHLNAYREPFHNNLKDLRDYITELVSVPNVMFTIDPLVSTTAGQLTALGMGSEAIAYRYALKELNPFAILGDTANAAFYNRFNVNGELDLYNATDRTGELTTEWLTDRAAFLTWKNIANTQNALTHSSGITVLQSAQITASLHYFDLTQKIDFGIVPPGGTVLALIDAPRFVFSGDSTDAVHGGSVVDHLYGGGATDYLQGRGGNDYLEGGQGLDIYTYGGATGILGSTNDGVDVIRDTDGKGVLRYMYSPLIGNPQSTVIAEASVKLSDTQWQSANGKFTYTRSGSDLIVTISGDAEGGFTLKDFRDGDFGIRLLEARPAPQTTHNFYGDTADWDSDPAQPGIQTQPDGFGNVKRADGQEGREYIELIDRADSFFDSPDGDHIITGGGNDGVNGAKGGNDWIETGDGRDIVYAVSTNPTHSKLIEGGTGDDLLTGGPGNDELYANTRVGWAQAINAGNGAGNGLHGDWLSGDWGDDVLVGDFSNDGFAGGMGRDVVIAGAGDDNVFGDADWVGTTLDWFYVDDPQTNVRTFFYFNGSENYDVGDADVIYAGSGIDYVWAGGGDDLVWGELGADQLVGQSGSDILTGGEGDDKMWGDDGRLAIPDYGGDYLDGGAGNDALHGEGGNDVLVGGAGADSLFGGAGKDIYLFNKGDGVETISDPDDLDGTLDAQGRNTNVDKSIIVLGEGISKTQVKFSRGSLLIDLGDGDEIHLALPAGQTDPSATRVIDQLQFADGSAMTFDDILAQGFDIDGTEGNDNNDPPDQPPRNLVGTAVVDRIRGLGGNDLLFGLGGDDVLDGGDDSDQLVGGAGADVMSGGNGDDFLWGDDSTADQGHDTLDGGGGVDQMVGYAGNDTYVFGRGYGQDIVFDRDTTVGNLDIVQFAADVSPDEVTATQEAGTYNLRLAIDGTADALIIANHFFSADDKIEEIRFADGTVWSSSSIPMLITGSSGNDILDGTPGPDAFTSGAGSDILVGGTGNDVYRYYRGDQADYIIDSDATAGNVDRIVFAADILPSQVTATRSGNNLRLAINALDSITMEDYFLNDGATPKSVEEVKFLSDSTVWDVATVKQMVLAGTSGNDVITGYASDDDLTGLGGNDTLIGSAGNDTLNGGTGNDLLQGGTGNDLYLFSRGDGQDAVIDSDATPVNVDILRFATDVLPADVHAQRNIDDLVLTVTGSQDQVTITDYFIGDGAGSSFIERIEFLADGTVLDYSAIKQSVLTGTESTDQIIGFESSDFIDGKGGPDALFGRGGNDTLHGGSGSDTLQGELGDDHLDGGFDTSTTDVLVGGAGNDTYRFGRGAGGTQIYDSGGASFSGDIDTLLISGDVLPGDVQLERTTQSALMIRIAGDASTADLPAQFNGDGHGVDSIERIVFLADGTIWDAETINAKVSIATNGNDALYGFDLRNDAIDGLAGNDTINGLGGNDALTGGAGTDLLQGGAGSDTYRFVSGSGIDIITNTSADFATAADVLEFGTGILPSQIATTRLNNDLVLTVSGTTDQSRITNYFLGNANIVDQIRFADGTVWTEQTIAGHFPVNGTSGNDSLQGSGLAEVINGLAGADTLRGGAGNDTMDGGPGSDAIYGEDGDDTLIAGTGDHKNSPALNTMSGGSGSDVLVGSGKNDFFFSDAGNDIMLGGAGSEIMEDSGGNSLFSGGTGNDWFRLSDQRSLVIGGPGGDSIDGDSQNINGIYGSAVVCYNKGAGIDDLFRLGAGSTLSLGGGIRYSDLAFSAAGGGLVISVARKTALTIFWYGDISFPPNKTISTLQIVIEGTSDYSPTSTDPMRNQKIQTFNFFSLVAAWDAAGRPSNFNIANNLAAHHLGGSDTAMIGGAAAYQYARTGSISSLTHDQMRAIVSDPGFGASAQSITATAGAEMASEGAGTAADETGASFLTEEQELPGEATDSTVEDRRTLAEPGLPPVPEFETPGRNVEIAASESLEVHTAKPALPGHVSTGGSGGPVGTALPTVAIEDPGTVRTLEGQPFSLGNSTDSDVDTIADSWFTRRSPNEYLSLLDDILRDESTFAKSARGSMAAAWEASHRWLSHNADPLTDAGDTSGADLSGLSLLGAGNAVYDMPRATVGLQEVSGHALKSFRGLREGMNVLTQS